MSDPMEFINNIRTGFKGVDINIDPNKEHTESSAYAEIVSSITARLRKDPSVTIGNLIEHPEIQAVLFSALYEYLSDAERFICNTFNGAEETFVNLQSHSNFHAATDRMTRIFEFIVSSSKCDVRLLDTLINTLHEDNKANRR
jgi:CRISPR/Cas system endoribonuclease Cas6 (RAMP superfamily)